MNTQQQVRKLLYWVHKKVDGEQGGIPTIFDNMVIDQANFYLRSTDPDGQLPVVLRRAFDTLQTSSDERFIDVATRIRNLPVSDLDTYGRMYSQECNTVSIGGAALLKVFKIRQSTKCFSGSFDRQRSSRLEPQPRACVGSTA
jgi:hypothetical protein